MALIGMHCASLRDSLFAETGLLASRPSLQPRASVLFLRAASLATQLFEGEGTNPGEGIVAALSAELDAAAAAVSGDNGFDQQLTMDVLSQAEAALARVSEAFGL